MDRFKSGIKEFNDITKGVPTPGAYLVLGDPGAGKSVFTFNFAAVKESKKIVVLTNNTPTETQAFLKDIKVKMEPTFVDCYSWLSGADADVDSLSNLSKILVVIEDNLSKNSIVVLDSLTPLVFYNDPDVVERFLQELVAVVKANQSVLMVILDKGTYHADAENTFESIVDGVIFLDKEKGLRITKMHDTKVLNKDYFYEVTEKGFKLRGK